MPQLRIDHECRRREALHELAILDTDPEPGFDQLTALAADLFDAPIALISLIDDERQWFKSCIGLSARSTPRKIAFCDYTIRQDLVMVVPDAMQDSRFFDNPLVTGEPHVRFYAGAPLRFDGALIGTLCIIDTKPRHEFDETQTRRLTRIADSVSAALAMRQDAIAKKATIRQLQETQRKLELMEEVAGVGYWHIQVKEQKAFWSRGVYAINGRTADDYHPEIASSISFFHPDDRAKVEACVAQAMADGQDFTFECRLIRADGEERIVYSKGGVERDENGAPGSIFGILEDVTEQSRIEETLRLAKEHAEAHQQAKSDFLSNMSHEIRTPLTTILGYADLLKRVEELPKDAKHYIGRINKAGDALLSLVTDVLDFSKLEAGQVKLDPQPADIFALSADIIDQFQTLTETRNIEVKLTYAPGTAAWLMIDDVRLRQVLYNLVGNACKFTQNGTVSLCLDLSQKRGATHLRVVVQDSGPGLTEVQQAHLFTRFNQVDNSINRKYGGSGLGLSICYEIVRLMQGEIGVESEVGVGSRFWFEVPVTQIEAPVVAKPGDNLMPVFLEDRKVLIVDDHPINRELIRLLLNDYGLDIYEASDGEEAVEMCLKVKFDLVFMDIQMPVLDGVTATQRIREQGGRNLPDAIVALSAATQTKLLDDTKGHGFTHVLCKPIDLPQFYATLYRCLEGEKASGQLAI